MIAQPFVRRSLAFCGLEPALALLVLLVATGQAQDFTYTNTNGTVTILLYSGSGGAVTIPSVIDGLPVTSIGPSAFFDHTNITSVTVADSVTNIGPHAFDHSLSLYSLNLGNGLTTIGDYAFSRCNNLTNVVIPDSVATIGEGVFSFGSLSIVSVGKGVTNIGLHAFGWGSGDLSAINVDPQNTAYSSSDGVLFDKTQTRLITCPQRKAGSYAVPVSVTIIEPEAFFYCDYLTNVVVAGGVTNIGDNAFAACFGLESVALNDGLLNIGASAFASSALTVLRIPDSVTAIGSNAFTYCESLTNLIIGSNVATIGEHAFELCNSLASVTLPRNLRSIGQYAFANCLDLVAVYLQGNPPAADCTVFTNYGNFSAAPNNVKAYYLPGTTGWGATFACVPARLWNPQAQTGDGSFGVRMSRFGFNVTGTADIPLTIEASADLAARSWIPLQSCKLTNGSIYFSDPHWTNYASRSYRIRSP